VTEPVDWMLLFSICIQSTRERVSSGITRLAEPHGQEGMRNESDACLKANRLVVVRTMTSPNMPIFFTRSRGLIMKYHTSCRTPVGNVDGRSISRLHEYKLDEITF